MKKIILSIAALGLTFILGAGAALGYFIHNFKQPSAVTAETIINIPSGSSAQKIDQILVQNGLSQHHNHFRFGVRLHKTGHQMKAGEFLIPANSSLFDIMNIIKSGKTHQYKITFAEGLTTQEILDGINQEDKLTGVISTPPAEGSLLPESYYFNRHDSKASLIQRMQSDFTTTLDILWDNKAADLPFKTKKEAIILASIVEKETGISSEREMVAGVFVNRLKKGIALQSDPTVIYAVTMGKKPLGRPIYKKDLKKASPYNTYHVRGLPPGPIANPGKASLKAVLNPAQHDYYYFVADGSGGHAFSKTLTEHNQNVAQWRKIERQRKQK